jgi:hypothetical protein
MREIYPGVYAPTMKTDAPAPSSKALRYVNQYTDARFEAWETYRSEAELGLKAELSAFEADREAQRQVIEVAAKEMEAARKAAQAYREGGLKTLEGAAEFKANAVNRETLANADATNEADRFLAGEKNDAALFSAGQANRAAISAANRTAGGARPPTGVDEKGVESLADATAFSSTSGQTPGSRFKAALDTVDNQSNMGSLTKDRQPMTPAQADYAYGQVVARDIREGKSTAADAIAVINNPKTDAYTADRLTRALANMPQPTTTGAGGAVVGGRGAGAGGYAPTEVTLQGMDIDPILAEQERLAKIEDEKAAAAEQRVRDAQALLAAMGYPTVDLTARQRELYFKNQTPGSGVVERLYDALLAEEQAKGLSGKAAEKSARKRLLAGDRPGNQFDDPTLPDNLPARDRTTGPGVTEVIDLSGDDPGVSMADEDSIEFAPTDLSMITQEDTPIEFAPTDLSMITQTPSGLAGLDREALLALLGDDPTEDYLKSGGRLSAPDPEPEPTPQEIDQAAKIDALLEARTLAKKSNKLRRLTDNTEEGRTARDLVRANKNLERPQPLEALRQKLAETYAQDPARQRRGIVLLYAQDMADKNARRQSEVKADDVMIADMPIEEVE